MKFILKALALAVVLLVCWKLFPTVFVFKDITAVIVTSVLIYIAGLVFAAVFSVVLIFILDKVDIYLQDIPIIRILLIAYVLSIALYSGAIILISKYYTEFAFAGTWWQLLLTSFILSIATNDYQTNSSNN